MKAKKKKRPAKFEVYKDSAGRWRWRMKAGNGKKLARSSEGDGWARPSGAAKNLVAVLGAVGINASSFTAGSKDDVQTIHVENFDGGTVSFELRRVD